MTVTPPDAVIAHWIDGGHRESTGGFADVSNPATGRVSGRVGLASSEDAAAAIASAVGAFPAWRDTSLTRRTQILLGAAPLEGHHAAVGSAWSA